VSSTSTLYLLHFEPAYQAPIGDTGLVKVAGHYLGSTAGSAEARLAEHLAGRGSPLVRAAVAAGCAIELVAIGAGDKKAERRLKRRHQHSVYCPRCSSSPKPLSAGGDHAPA
jgi:hypothetical protein